MLIWSSTLHSCFSASFGLSYEKFGAIGFRDTSFSAGHPGFGCDCASGTGRVDQYDGQWARRRNWQNHECLTHCLLLFLLNVYSSLSMGPSTGLRNCTISTVQILIFLALQWIPSSMYEVARLDSYKIFWKITFPMVSPLLTNVICLRTVPSQKRYTTLLFSRWISVLSSTSMAWVYYAYSTKAYLGITM